MRIGYGYDVHRFAADGDLVLGGVVVPHHCGLEAHSDGDVLLHAVADALLGAIAAGDIGLHFPDNDPRWRGADSAELLRQVVAQVEAAGYGVGNLDATVVAQAPRLRPHVDRIRQRIAALLAVAVDRISVKATTAEGLDAVGREEGIAAHAVVLVVPHG